MNNQNQDFTAVNTRMQKYLLSWKKDFPNKYNEKTKSKNLNELSSEELVALFSYAVAQECMEIIKK